MIWTTFSTYTTVVLLLYLYKYRTHPGGTAVQVLLFLFLLRVLLQQLFETVRFGDYQTSN